MSIGPLQVETLSAQHQRAAFHSCSPALNQYLHEQVSQDVRRRVTSCFVACTAQGQIAAYYTLAASSIWLGDLPTPLAKKLPRYPTVPAVRMGRLAVAQTHQGQGLGAAMLGDALARARQAEIAAYAMVVDAKDQAAAAFYQHHGFVAFDATPLTLFLPLASVRGLG